MWNSDSSTLAGLACFTLPMRGPGGSLRSAPHASERLYLARVRRPSPAVVWPGGLLVVLRGGSMAHPRRLAAAEVDCQGAMNYWTTAKERVLSQLLTWAAGIGMG